MLLRASECAWMFYKKKNNNHTNIALDSICECDKEQKRVVTDEHEISFLIFFFILLRFVFLLLNKSVSQVLSECERSGKEEERKKSFYLAHFIRSTHKRMERKWDR